MYRTYKLYTYATSYIIANTFAEKIVTNEENAVERYLTFLSAGGSDYPIHLLKNAGVDITSSEPFEKTMDSEARILDEIERILAKKGIWYI